MLAPRVHTSYYLHQPAGEGELLYLLLWPYLHSAPEGEGELAQLGERDGGGGGEGVRAAHLGPRWWVWPLDAVRAWWLQTPAVHSRHARAWHSLKSSMATVIVATSTQNEQHCCAYALMPPSPSVSSRSLALAGTSSATASSTRGSSALYKPARPEVVAGGGLGLARLDHNVTQW